MEQIVSVERDLETCDVGTARLKSGKEITVYLSDDMRFLVCKKALGLPVEEASDLTRMIHPNYDDLELNVRDYSLTEVPPLPWAREPKLVPKGTLIDLVGLCNGNPRKLWLYDKDGRQTVFMSTVVITGNYEVSTDTFSHLILEVGDGTYYYVKTIEGLPND